MTEPMGLIGNHFQTLGTVARKCKTCGAVVYVQIENVPLVDNSGGAYFCLICAANHDDMVCQGFAHHGTVHKNPSAAELAQLIGLVNKYK